MSNRFRFVSVSGSNSKLSKLNYGVPQGSVLGPILFVLYTQPLSQILFNHSSPHQFFADDTHLRKSCCPEYYDDIRNALQTCISDIKDWMTENKLQLKADKTKTMLFNSSKLKHPPASLSICQVTSSFSDSVRNLGFYLDKDISMKEHINFICKTAFMKIRHICTIRHYLTDDVTKTLVVSLVLSCVDYCNSLGWSPPVLGRQTSESKTVQPVL